MCGPAQAIDLSQGTGWSSSTGDNNADLARTIVPKSITVRLSQAIDISSSAPTAAFAVDPTATCGDSDSFSTGEYKIEVSPDGSTWTTAVDGSGAAGFTSANRYQLVNVPSSVSVGGVQYVRFTMLSRRFRTSRPTARPAPTTVANSWT